MIHSCCSAVKPSSATTIIQVQAIISDQQGRTDLSEIQKTLTQKVNSTTEEQILNQDLIIDLAKKENLRGSAAQDNQEITDNYLVGQQTNFLNGIWFCVVKLKPKDYN